MDDFESAITECEFDVLALTETWLTDGVKSSELFPTVYRKDRKFNTIRRIKGVAYY